MEMIDLSRETASLFTLPCTYCCKIKALKAPLLLFLSAPQRDLKLATIVNECMCSKDSGCALDIFWIEWRLVLTCFPSRTRTVLFHLAGDLSRHLRMQKCLTWFLLAVPKSQYLTFHFPSLVLSDCHLIQPGRSNPQLSACTENWGFSMKVFGGNYLCRECTEERSVTKLFDVNV